MIAKPSHVTPAVTISVSVPAGSASDPPGVDGASHFLSQVIDRGTESRSGDELAELLDSRGVSLTVSAMRHAFVVSCTCLSEDFSTILALVADVVRNPSLPEAEIATRRGEIVTAIRQDQDNPAMVAVEEQLALLYPDGHPYGRRVKGTLETVGRIDRDVAAGAARRPIHAGGSRRRGGGRRGAGRASSRRPARSSGTGAEPRSLRPSCRRRPRSPRAGRRSSR